MTQHYQDALPALADAAVSAPMCVGYRQGKGWFTYSPLTGCPPDAEPEFFIAKQGTHPIPLSNLALEVWLSAVKSLTNKRTKDHAQTD